MGSICTLMILTRPHARPFFTTLMQTELLWAPAGIALLGGAQPHSFQIVNGKFEYLSVPGALWEYANGINGSGVIVGGAAFAISNTQGVDKGFIAHCQ